MQNTQKLSYTLYYIVRGMMAFAVRRLQCKTKSTLLNKLLDLTCDASQH
jgi:hypothetical protein